MHFGRYFSISVYLVYPKKKKKKGEIVCSNRHLCIEVLSHYWWIFGQNVCQDPLAGDKHWKHNEQKRSTMFW